MMLHELVVLAAVGGKTLGVIIPALIFIISFVVTWLLYKHFSAK